MQNIATSSPSATLTLTNSPAPADRNFIGDALAAYNLEQTGIADSLPLDVQVRNPKTGELEGGLVGRTSLGVFFIELFSLPPALRKQGYGSQMLRMAENEARRRGCQQACLFTMAIQAPEFYKKHGYEEFGRIACAPAGNARIFMRKKLDNKETPQC